jgi:hypothetical protein
MLVLPYDRGDTQRWARAPTQIAYSLHLAEGTVKRHLANTCEKMSVHSKAKPPGWPCLGSGSPSSRPPTTLQGPKGGGR